MPSPIAILWILAGVPIVAALALVALLLAWAGPSAISLLLHRHPAPAAPVNPRPAAACDSTLNLGFHIQTFSSGLRAAVWYPTTSAETQFRYPGSLTSSMALDAPVAACARYPLVVFSHGFGGCGVQSAFFTEELARAGYIVVAPDHNDALCKVDQPLRGNFLRRGKERFVTPGKWTDATYRDRADDIRLALDEILRDPRFGPSIDASRIGAAGHSLGGYTILGLSGARASWKDDRIKAALVMSPYLTPYLTAGTLPSVHIPLMYVGGTGDFTITPRVRRSGGAYDVSNSPKYWVEFAGVYHLDFSNIVCRTYGSIPACLEKSASARLINAYGIAFFNRYLKGQSEPLLDRSNSELAEYRHVN